MKDRSNQLLANDSDAEGGDYAIKASNLCKTYRIFNRPQDRILASVPGIRARRVRFRDFEALRNISFQLERGQTLGIVGRNGSGKSTLLQILCGTLTPSSGNYTVKGRIGALLELGSGFNPEFTGIENIYINASILGLKKDEIDSRLDKILGFADIGDFINQPVKTYSSGMIVRLAFAVQAHCEPQVLIVDEALAVGDELFQKKCYLHLENLKESGASIVLVTHSCPQINQQCDSALLLNNGRCLLQDEPKNVTFLYQQLMNEPENKWIQVTEAYKAQQSNKRSDTNSHKGISQTSESSSSKDEAECKLNTSAFDEGLVSKSTIIYPEHGAKIKRIEIKDQSGRQANVIPMAEKFSIVFHYSFAESFASTVFTCYVSRHTGEHVTGQSMPPEEKKGIATKKGGVFSIEFFFEGGLWPGTYFIGGGITSPECKHRFIHRLVDGGVFKVLSKGSPRIHGSSNISGREPLLRMSREE